MGEPAEPIRFEVDRALDAGSLSSRRVVALQHGRPILVSSVSFQRPGKGDDFQQSPPEAPEPHSLPSERERAIAAGTLDQSFMITTGEDLDVRLVQPVDWLNPRPMAPEMQAWMRTTAALPDDPALHAAVIAYMSDVLLIDVCLAATGRSYWVDDCRVASLDHALWWHTPLRADEWLLHAVAAERVAGGRGLARGSFYNASGVLVASAAQQGLMRLR
jgi:acyl-CoA thioesterase-2